MRKRPWHRPPRVRSLSGKMRVTQNRITTIVGSTYSVPAPCSVLSTRCFIEQRAHQVGAMSLGLHMRNLGFREAPGEAGSTCHSQWHWAGAQEELPLRPVPFAGSPAACGCWGAGSGCTGRGRPLSLPKSGPVLGAGSRAQSQVFALEETRGVARTASQTYISQCTHPFPSTPVCS